MAEIKVVLWDIDGTLLSFAKAQEAAMARCFRKMNLGVCSKEMNERYTKINEAYWQRLERGELKKQQVLTGRFLEFFSVYGLDEKLAEPFGAYYQQELGEQVFFQEGAPEIVKVLKGQVLQYAATNGTKAVQEKKLAKSGLDQLLDGVFISDDIGAEKPSPVFFQRAFEKIGTYKREEILMVGDSLTSDIQGGRNAGIRTCWYNPEEKEKDQGLLPDYEIRKLFQVAEILKENKRMEKGV
jgi:YjjG family noncanonical pyrimidine nucleotidase